MELILLGNSTARGLREEVERDPETWVKCEIEGGWTLEAMMERAGELRREQEGVKVVIVSGIPDIMRKGEERLDMGMVERYRRQIRACGMRQEVLLAGFYPPAYLDPSEFHTIEQLNHAILDSQAAKGQPAIPLQRPVWEREGGKGRWRVRAGFLKPDRVHTNQDGDAARMSSFQSWLRIYRGREQERRQDEREERERENRKRRASGEDKDARKVIEKKRRESGEEKRSEEREKGKKKMRELDGQILEVQGEVDRLRAEMQVMGVELQRKEGLERSLQVLRKSFADGLLKELEEKEEEEEGPRREEDRFSGR